MAIVKKDRNFNRIIDLDGPNGNAFYLLGVARSAGKEIYPADELTGIIEQMMSADYTNLLQIFEDNFGGFYTLVTTNENLLNNIKNR